MTQWTPPQNPLTHTYDRMILTDTTDLSGHPANKAFTIFQLIRFEKVTTLDAFVFFIGIHRRTSRTTPAMAKNVKTLNNNI